MSTCRLLPYTIADGPHNMAADEVLLRSAATGTASLRFYGWSEPTLSLGYFQSENLRHDDPRLAELPFVRRPSGGATLVHHHEVTYGLALPPGPPWQGTDSWLCRMHAILAAALRSLGVAAQTVGCEEERHLGPVLCFQHWTAGDLLVGNAKIAGSAQRRQRGALMQHGAVLLATSPHAPALLGIRELTGQNLPVETLCQAVVREFARQTAWDLVPGAWTDAERQRIAELATGKYGAAAWNGKR